VGAVAAAELFWVMFADADQDWLFELEQLGAFVVLAFVVSPALIDLQDADHLPVCDTPDLNVAAADLAMYMFLVC
jgi:hypothetical protein